MGGCAVPIIAPHEIFLYGSTSELHIVLRPLSDAHLPHLYRWMADPEVTYYTESAIGLKYDEATVRRKYGGMSQCALCFLVEANGAPVGECWLQKMNRTDVIAMYPKDADVRRIDMCIGEKEYWNKGIGTAMIGMLVDYAFAGEHADVLHCFCEDHNPRSERMWQKHGFSLVKREAEVYNPKWRSPIGKWQLHYALTRAEYVAQRRVRIPPEKVFLCPVGALQPSQLFISAGKLALAQEWFSGDATDMDPIPVKRFMGRVIMTDGHTRAVMAHRADCAQIPCYWDDDVLDMAAYAADVAACLEAGVRSPVDLAARIIPAREYETLWRKWCMDKYGKPRYRYLVEREEVIFWTEKTVPEAAHDIRALGTDDLPTMNRHLVLCGQNPGRKKCGARCTRRARNTSCCSQTANPSRGRASS